ncbi:MAG: protein kinase [Candidatus Sumerlaeota bacterium]|nr:protein kinase [Candidatus Sumerlaeota bacterium]
MASPPNPPERDPDSLNISSFGDIGPGSVGDERTNIGPLSVGEGRTNIAAQSVGEGGTVVESSPESAAPAAAVPGATMDGGRLTLIEKLGEGGMGIVWKARDERINRFVAIKQPKGAMLTTAKGRARFLREAKSAAKLSHPNIVTIHQFAEDAGVPFIEMEFVEGLTLREAVREAREDAAQGAGGEAKDGWDWKRVCGLFIQLCDALALAHDRGVIHRDLKPGNILLNQRGVPKIADFGLAAAEDAEGDRTSMTATGAMLGTFYYAAPEQLRDAKSADARSDLYSLGATLYFSLTGRDPRMLNLDQLPPPARPIVQKAMDEHPANRYASMREMQEALRAALDAGDADECACPKCGNADNPISARHCGACGASLVSLFKPCPQCKVDNRKDVKFCLGCGANLSALAEAEMLREEIARAEQMHQYEELERLALRGIEIASGDTFFQTKLQMALQAQKRIRGLQQRLDETPAREITARIGILEELLHWQPGDARYRTAFEAAQREKARQAEEANQLLRMHNIKEIQQKLDTTPATDFDEWIALLERLHELQPDDVSLQPQIENTRREKREKQIRDLHGAARQLYEARRFDEALDFMKKAQALSPDSDSLRRAIQRIEETRGKFIKQRDDFLTALDSMMARGAYAQAIEAITKSPIATDPQLEALAKTAAAKRDRIHALASELSPLRDRKAYAAIAAMIKEMELLIARFPEHETLKAECEAAISLAARYSSEAQTAFQKRKFAQALSQSRKGLAACSDYEFLKNLSNRAQSRRRWQSRLRKLAAFALATVILGAGGAYWINSFLNKSQRIIQDEYDWTQIKQSSSAKQIESYLSRYPEGKFRKPALDKLLAARQKAEARYGREGAEGQQGSAEAQECYQKGLTAGWQSDYAEAMRWHTKAAEAGNAKAMRKIGVLYENGQAVAQDYKQAMQWYSKAAENGNARAMNNIGNLYNGGHGVLKDYALAMQWYRKAADAGDARAMLNIGNLYFYAQGIEKDYVQATQWFRKAADAGNTEAMICVGLRYVMGQGVPQDYAQAMQWFQKATDAGDPGGTINIGKLFYFGHGVPQDYAQAMQWTRKAADDGDTLAMTMIGDLYASGHGVAQDYKQAMQWYMKAADGGNTMAMNWIGSLYYNAHGVDKDYAQAMQWFRKAADNGDAMAMNSIGQLYEHGEGVAKDGAQAMQWYRKAAEAGDARAMFNVGLFYNQGQGVAQDNAQAMHWWRKSADAGNIGAMNNLAILYDEGKGVPQDFTQALQWFRKAADSGDATAMRNLGNHYADGRGVKQDKVEAAVWLSLAAANGDEEAAKSRDEIARSMTSEQISEGQRRAAAYQSAKRDIKAP